MGFPLRQTGGWEHEEKAENLDSSQSALDHSVVHYLAPAITDFILDKNQKCRDNKLEQTLTLLHSERSKEIEPLHPLIVINLINQKVLEFMHENMQWEAPSMFTTAYHRILCSLFYWYDM